LAGRRLARAHFFFDFDPGDTYIGFPSADLRFGQKKLRLAIQNLDIKAVFSYIEGPSDLTGAGFL
jgi:hypothetical protein